MTIRWNLQVGIFHYSVNVPSGVFIIIKISSSSPVSASFPQTTLHLLPVYYVRNELISGHINHLLAVAFSAERFLRQLVTDNRGNISHQFLHKPRSLALRHHATNCRISQGSALSSSGGRFGTCRPIPSTSSTACSHAVKRTQDPRELRSSSAYSRIFPCTLPILSRIQGKNYHNVVDINESLVALASQLLNKRLAVLTEMLKTVGRIDQLTAKTLKYAALWHDLFSIVQIVRSANLKVLSSQSNPTILSLDRIVGLCHIQWLTNTSFQWVGYFVRSKKAGE